MTEVTYSQPKALTPRKLEERENLQTLNHWKSVLTNYYRRCQFYGIFLQPGVTWSNAVNHGFTDTETTGLLRDPETLAYDLEGFLTCIAGYLPFDYVSTKLITQTTCLKDVWQIIYEIDDAEVSTIFLTDSWGLSSNTFLKIVSVQRVLVLLIQGKECLLDCCTQ